MSQTKNTGTRKTKKWIRRESKSEAYRMGKAITQTETILLDAKQRQRLMQHEPNHSWLVQIINPPQ